MKKILLLGIVLLLITGCSKQIEEEIQQEAKVSIQGISDNEVIKIKDYINDRYEINQDIIQINTTETNHKVILLKDGRKIIMSKSNYDKEVKELSQLL